MPDQNTQTRHSAALYGCVAGLAAIVLLLIFSTPSLGSAPQVAAMAAAATPEQDPPTVLAVLPNSAPNNLDVTITITGTGFQSVLSGTQVLTAPLVSLEGSDLAKVGWVSSRTLTATVPWGLDAAVYTATVTNPDGQFGSLGDAFTVTQAIGVWTTGGPYGGNINDIAASPATSQIAFASIPSVGLFRTTNGGDWWELSVREEDIWGVMYGIAPAYPLFYWGSTGLWRSDDSGQSFEQLYEPLVTAFAPDPVDPQAFWAMTPSDAMFTANGGQDWELRSTGLPTDTWLASLTVDPVTPSTLYAITADGRVLKTVDAGQQWLPTGGDMPDRQHSMRLAVHPFSPDVLLFCNAGAEGTGYRSTDGGASWALIEVAGKPDSDLSDLAFSPLISGTVYASDNEGGKPALVVSTDGGATWAVMAGWDGSALRAMAADAATGQPLYVGSESEGAWRSPDGGQSWDHATEGIFALQILDIAESPSQPATIMMAGVGAGAFVSDNAAHGWQRLDTPLVYAISVAADPLDADVIYVNTGLEVSYSRDGGQTWERGDRFDERAFWAMAPVAASDPSVLYIGGRPSFAPELGNIGLAARSDDYGVTWTPLTFTLPVSGVFNIVVDPADAQVVYVMAGAHTDHPFIHPGKGLFRSTDGGQTWEPRKTGIGDAFVYDLAFHPEEPETIYATGWLSSEQAVTVFKSTDGSATWEPTSLRTGIEKAVGRTFAVTVDPTDPDIVYAGNGEGLFRSADGGQTWSRAAGVLAYARIADVSAVSLDGRTFLYAAVRGGDVGAGSAMHAMGTRPAGQDYVQSGVYQYTDTHQSPPIIYLPLVMRAE